MKVNKNLENDKIDYNVHFEAKEVVGKGAYEVFYQTNKFKSFIEITGHLIQFHSGKSEDYKFEPDEIEKEYEKVYDQNWEQIEEDILNGFAEYALTKGGIDRIY
ncbi:hypothetical protein MATR_19450 [Marivirga tractuosa]|uniref:Uncharacterized protein n=1 Tax=Marivirga tractuosa (strain ATCC 23168 / DSM 4126 / NBRC 15989 / NCIMB 1408 / VKM B-1430 / H-43) TaxID=643867 RepID=E4TNH8_MARTH|nr:hypothetical protein [Marivirga tractuosa]ADR20435.1 hypothetical protein Ftrac_0429 [Marivirga tractuosa DSM 4126]BDD15120.1 hypothetical protein MATR_19450 [Marivirga tractuosa]